MKIELSYSEFLILASSLRKEILHDMHNDGSHYNCEAKLDLYVKLGEINNDE
jgi:hypothetical protein